MRVRLRSRADRNRSRRPADTPTHPSPSRPARLVRSALLHRLAVVDHVAGAAGGGDRQADNPHLIPCKPEAADCF